MKLSFQAQQPIKVVNVVGITFLHLLSLYGILFWSHNININTVIWSIFIGIISGLGVTAGAHRLWTHRAYKAKTPLQIILIIFYSTAGQNTLFDWVRDHRIHHKFSETDADPHNAKRGFFFAHVGWLMQKKHPEVLKKGAMIDMSDITNDPILAFFNKYFSYFKLLFCFVIPSAVPYVYWDENLINSIMASAVCRYTFNLNFTWLVNSAAHIWGNKPYDNRINPAENKSVAILSLGEGWHNYHHVFPWDYKAAELGDYKLNLTTAFIDFFAKIGWAYDLKTPSSEIVKKTIMKHGDGSHSSCNQDFNHSEIPYPANGDN